MKRIEFSENKLKLTGGHKNIPKRYIFLASVFYLFVKFKYSNHDLNMLRVRFVNTYNNIQT